MRQHWLACKALTSESSTVNASAADVHQSDAAARPSGATTSTAGADSDASWKECGEIPAPEAYAALKLQVQVVRETVVCVQPCVQPASSASTTQERKKETQVGEEEEEETKERFIRSPKLGQEEGEGETTRPAACSCSLPRSQTNHRIASSFLH